VITSIIADLLTVNCTKNTYRQEAQLTHTETERKSMHQQLLLLFKVTNYGTNQKPM